VFASPYGVIISMAFGLPVLYVTMCDSYEFLKKHNASEIVSPYNYERWTKNLKI